MLAVPTILGQQQITHLTPTARGGTSLTAGSPGHTKGAWVTVIAQTPYDAHGIWIAVFGTWGGSSSFGNTQLVDVAVGPPGGERVIVPNYDASCVPSPALGIGNFDPFMTFFPVYVRRGSRIAARNQSSGSGSGASIMIALEGLPLYAPWGVGPVVDYGTDLGATRGTAVTPGVNAWGAWTLIGTTSRMHTWWTMGMDHQNDTTVSSETYLIEIGVGPDGDQQSLGIMRWPIQSLWAQAGGLFPAFLASRPIPAGTAIWARMAAATAEPRGVIVYGA
jgi:hypothetical protein